MDNVLEFLVQAGNRDDFKAEITLNVNGSVVKGTLISAHDYFKRLSETFKEGNEVAQELSRQLKRTGEIASAAKGAPARFIHLENAEIYLGDRQPTPSQGEVLWRGKLEEVDSFSIDQGLKEELANQQSGDQEEESKEEESKEEESSSEDNDGLMNRLDQLEDKVKNMLTDSDEEEEDEKDSDQESSPEEESKEDEEDKKSKKSKKDGKKSEEKSKKDQKSAKDKKDSDKKK